MLEDQPPCARMKLGSSNYEQFISSTAESPLNTSVYGFVVFLVIFTFFSALVAGLLFCLTKIWCSRPTTDPSVINQKLREQILRSPVYMGDSDSDDESTIQQTVDSTNTNNNHISQKVLNYVHKSLTDLSKRDLELQKSLNEADGAVARCANVAAGHVLAFVESESPLLAPPSSLHPPTHSRLPSCLRQHGRRSLPFYSIRTTSPMSRSSTVVEL